MATGGGGACVAGGAAREQVFENPEAAARHGTNLMSRMQRYEAAVLRERVARARLLLQLASDCDDSQLADLLAFARQIGGRSPAADTLAALRAAIGEELRAAQAELDAAGPPRD